MSTLYLCYQSLLEPLTQTQVVAYLEGLAQAGYRTVLLTFEPRSLSREEAREWRVRLAERGITWHWLRYHKRPTVPATAWDVTAGIVAGLRLIRRYQVRLLHARAHVPGLMALALRRLTGVRLLFDVRGLMAEEYVEAGVWPEGGRLFRATKRVERSLVRAADGIVVLTHQAVDLLHQWYPQEIQGKALQVIPCCVDLRRIPRLPEGGGGNGMRSGRKTLVYAGKLGGWYLTEAMAGFMAAALRVIPDLHWQVWTQSDPTPLRQAVAACGLNDRVAIGRLSPQDLAAELPRARAGLSLIKPSLSKLASSPTKVGEYLAAGLPVVSSAGIGDLDALLAGPTGSGAQPVGVLVREFTESGYRQALPQLLELLEDPQTPARCRAAARENLDLERVGWTRYRQVYRHLLAP